MFSLLYIIFSIGALFALICNIFMLKIYWCVRYVLFKENQLLIVLLLIMWHFDAFTSMHDNRWEGEKEEDKEKEDKTKREKPKKKKKEEDKVVESKTPTTQKVGSKTDADNFSFFLMCRSKSWTGMTIIKSIQYYKHNISACKFRRVNCLLKSPHCIFLGRGKYRRCRGGWRWMGGCQWFRGGRSSTRRWEHLGSWLQGRWEERQGERKVSQEQRQLQHIAVGSFPNDISRKPQRAADSQAKGSHPLPSTRSGVPGGRQAPQPLLPTGEPPTCVRLGGGDGDAVAPE